jgi:hypothetical protein
MKATVMLWQPLFLFFAAGSSAGGVEIGLSDPPLVQETETPPPPATPTDDTPLPVISIPDEPPIPADNTGLDLSSPEERSDPDTESSNSDITVDACTDAMSSLCQLGDTYTFEESLRCLEVSGAIHLHGFFFSF